MTENLGGPPSAQGVRWGWSLAALAIYVPIAGQVLEASKRTSLLFFLPSPTQVLLFGPPLCALCAAFTLSYIGSGNAKSRDPQTYWLLLLLAAFLGWPVSCGTSAVLTAGSGVWLAH